MKKRRLNAKGLGPKVAPLALIVFVLSLGGSALAAPLVMNTVDAEELSTEDGPQDKVPSPRSEQGSETHTPEYVAEAVGLWGRPVKRGGFHLQVTFGVGGGPDTLGVFHAMELGFSMDDWTLGMLHTFIQNKGALGTDLGGPDLIGGWMLQYKRTLFYPDLVWKVAMGLGGIHDQSGEKLQAHSGFGASYGLDLHFPVGRSWGPTLSLSGMNVTALGQHHFGMGLGLGVTIF